MNFLIGLLVGFISIPIIYGIFIWFLMRLQEPSRDLLKKIGIIYIRNNLHTGNHSYNNYN